MKRDEFDIGEWSALEEQRYREHMQAGEKPGVASEMLLWLGVVLLVAALCGLAWLLGGVQ